MYCTVQRLVYCTVQKVSVEAEMLAGLVLSAAGACDCDIWGAVITVACLNASLGKGVIKSNSFTRFRDW